MRRVTLPLLIVVLTPVVGLSLVALVLWGYLDVWPAMAISCAYLAVGFGLLRRLDREQ